MLLDSQITQPGELTSVQVSSDSRFAIISHAPNVRLSLVLSLQFLTLALQEILYLDLRNGTILRRYQGHDQGEWVLQSCFGGALQNYVLSGSEGSYLKLLS